MNRFIPLFFIPFFLVAEPLPHCKENDFMMVSLPRSGSSFLFKMIREANPDIESTNEIFHYLLNPDHIFSNLKIKKEYLEYSFHTLPYKYLEDTYKQIWKNEKKYLDKEVLTFFNIPFFSNKFTIFCLYRHRKYTFPLKNNFRKMYERLYNAFLENNFENNPLLNTMQQYCLNTVTTPLQQHCAVHIIGNYIILNYCKQFSLKIINYEEIMQLSGEALHKYLEEKIPEKIYNKYIQKILQLNRKPGKTFLIDREERYNKLNVEPFCQELINFMKSLDPDMPYWYLLE